MTAHVERDFQETVQIEIDVGHRGEQRFFEECADCFVGFAEPTCMVGISRHPFQTIQDQLLHGLHVRVFAADTDTGHATHALSGLLALITKHETALEDRTCRGNRDHNLLSSRQIRVADGDHCQQAVVEASLIYIKADGRRFR